MNLRKTIKVLLVLLPFFFLFSHQCLASDNSYLTVVNPVRGEYQWNTALGRPIDGVTLQSKMLQDQGLFATWLLRSDALLSSEMVNFFRNLSSSSELGIFLEITPDLAKSAGVSYPSGGLFWHDANKIFLSGYKPEDRVKLLDTAFSQFKATFGYYPKSVGAWHVDAYSAAYMKQKYSVTGVLICADQFGTDGYQIWGGWWGVPYYPSKSNILTPAQTDLNKLDLVVFWWAARDPQLGYGGSVEESTYSVQVNDYQRHTLGIPYFRKLLDDYLTSKDNQFGQITIGLENDTDWQNFALGFNAQMVEIKARVVRGEVKVLTMSGFSDWYRKSFDKLSPDQKIGDFLMTKQFRLGLSEKEGKNYIRDLRIYNENWPEANLLTANPWGTLALNNPYKIDTIRFPDDLKEFSGTISLALLLKKYGSQERPFLINKLFLGLYFLSLLILLVTIFRKKLAALLLIIVGSISISVPMVKSGLVYPYGMGFWGPNGHDGIWHLSLINQFSKLSLGNPVFSGNKITNYHFGFDLLASVLAKVTGIAPVNLYFQILPPIFALLIGILTYKLIEQLTRSKTASWWGTFFVYFGGSFGWIISLLKSGTIGGESTFWANQAVSTLINPPYALSIVIILLGLIKFITYLEKPKLSSLVICSLLFGILIQIKVYAGVIVLGSLVVLEAMTFCFFPERKKEIGKLLLLSTVFSLLIYLPFNINSASLLVLSPLWFPRTMIAYADRVGWFKLENARITYLNSGQWLKWIVAEALALAIFLFGNLGTRIIGFFYVRSSFAEKRKVSEIEIFLFSFLVIALAIPLFFIQKGNPWNTIQFFYYFQFLVAILAGIVFGKFLEFHLKTSWQKVISYVLACLMAGLTLVTTVSTLKNDYLPSRPPSRVSIEELEALKFLANQAEGVVLAVPYNPDWRSKFSEPKPLYAYETTAYVSALGNKETYLEDEMNLTISGYDWQPRRANSVRFFLTNDISWANIFLKDSKIRYLYLVKGQKMNLGLQDVNAIKIFENGETVIYQVN